ncbi:hypothetical protein B566_EDAN017169 [Ephemera danica]|nr:hypothetical protein B566_EDAN017169 [Ephemera danica]
MSDEEQAPEPRYHNFSDVPKFTSETAEDWVIFIEMLQFYFESSGIKDLKLKKAILFAHTGPILYKQARKLISLPETTATISYDDVVKLLQKHYSPTVNVWLSRKRFESRNQYQNESFKDFVSELKVLAAPCGFEHIEKELLQLNRKALSAEAAKQDVANLHGASSSEVHRIYSASTVAHSTVQGKQNLASQAVRSKCNCCGASNHNQSNCWYKNAICRFCNVKGHIERACRKKAQSSAPSPTDSLLSAELVVNETKADPVLIVVKSKIIHRRLITNDPTVQEHLKKPNPTTWKIELPNLLLMLHVTPNPVTGKSPAQLLMGRCPRTLMDRAHPGTTVPASVVQTQAGGSTLAEGQKVMHRKYSSGPQWLRGTVSKVCRARHYILTTNTCMLMKRHIDQLITRKFTQSKSICYPGRGHNALASVPRDSINMEEPPSTNQEDIVSGGVFEDSDSTLQSEARQQDLSEDGPITAHTPFAQTVLNARTPSPLHSPFQGPSTPPSQIHRRESQRIKRVPTHLKDYV